MTSNYHTDNHSYNITSYPNEVDVEEGLSIAFVTTPLPEPDIQEPAFWVLHRVAMGMNKVFSLPEASREAWASLDSLLLRSSGHLHSIDVFCGNGVPEEDLVEQTVSRMRTHLASVGAKIHANYSADVSDGKELAPELFGNDWRRDELLEVMKNVLIPTT